MTAAVRAWLLLVLLLSTGNIRDSRASLGDAAFRRFAMEEDAWIDLIYQVKSLIIKPHRLETLILPPLLADVPQAGGLQNPGPSLTLLCECLLFTNVTCRFLIFFPFKCAAMCLRISGLADSCGGVVYLEETRQCLFANLDGLGGSRPMGNGPFGEQDMFMRAGAELEQFNL